MSSDNQLKGSQVTEDDSPMVTALYANGLKMIGMAYDSLEFSGFKSIILEMIKNKTSFDISDPEKINDLTADDLDKLRHFENENAGILVDMIRLADTIGYNNKEQHKINALMDSLNDRNSIQNLFQYIFGSSLVLISMIYIFCITFMKVPDSAAHVTDTVLGVIIGGLLSTIINYFFGGNVDKKKRISSSTSTSGLSSDNSNKNE